MTIDSKAWVAWIVAMLTALVTGLALQTLADAFWVRMILLWCAGLIGLGASILVKRLLARR